MKEYKCLKKKINYRYRVSKILVLKLKDLKELFNLVDKFCQKIKITISCIDDTTNQLNSIDDLTQYQNTSSREICEISFKGYDSNKSVVLTIENTHIVSFENVCIDIRGFKEDVNQLKHDIIDSISDMKALFLYRIFRKSLFPCAVITGITQYILSKLQIMFFLILPLRIISLLYLKVMIVNGLLPDKWSKFIKRKFLPTVTFAVRHGEKRYKNRKYIISIVHYCFSYSYIIILFFTLSSSLKYQELKNICFI